MTASRRDVLQWGLRASALLTLTGAQRGVSLAQLAQMAQMAQPAPTPERAQSKAAAAGGYELLDVVPFFGEGRNFVNAPSGKGPDARLAFDTSTLTSKKLVTSTDEFFVRTGYPEHLASRTDWQVGVQGLVQKGRTFSLAELGSMAEPLGVHLLECAGSTRNSYFGLMSAADWKGVPVSQILAKLTLKPEASRVLVSGVDPGIAPNLECGWIFSLEDLDRAGAAFAVEMNGVPLPKHHGAPVRLVVPGWYGCAWIKWVDKLVLLDEECEPTAQMMEYATRTQQAGLPRLARDFRPATIEQCAMPVRIEKWGHRGVVFYRVVGILWGGSRPTKALKISFDPEPGLVPVERYGHETNSTWTLWSHTWRPARPGRYRIRLVIDEPDIRSWRMGVGYYDRSVQVDEV